MSCLLRKVYKWLSGNITMAERVYFMSDDELRATLRSYGLANVPLTPTTRKVLEKKLVEKMSQCRIPPRGNYVKEPDKVSGEVNQPVLKNQDIRNPKTWLHCWLLLGLVYICIHILARRNIAFTNDKDSVIPICKLHIPGNIPGVNCVVSDQVGPAKDLLNILVPELTSRGEAFKCGKPVPPYLTTREMYDLINTIGSIELDEFHKRLANLMVLLEHNPSWGFNVITLNTKHDERPSLNNRVIDIDNVVITINVNERCTSLFCLTFYPIDAGWYILCFPLIIIAMLFLNVFLKYCITGYESDEIYLMIKIILLKILNEM